MLLAFLRSGLVERFGWLPLIPHVRRSPLAGAFLDGVNAASLALMGVVTWQLESSALVDWLAVVLLLVSAGFLIRYRVNSAWLVLEKGLSGFEDVAWTK